MGSSFTMLSSIGNFTSNGLSVPEEVPKHPWKLSRTMAKDSSIQRICHGCCPPPVPRLVSSRQAGFKSACKCDGHEWCSPKYLLDALPCWTSGFTEAAKKHRPQFPNHLLSDYFLLSARLLLSAYFLAVSYYKRMGLTTSAYGMSYILPCWYRRMYWPTESNLWDALQVF